MASLDLGEPPWSVAVVDNHEAARLGVMAYLLTRPDQFGPCAGFEGLEALSAATWTPRLIVLDLYLGRDDQPTIDAIPGLREAGSAVILFTSEERPVPLRRAVAVGVSGLVLKNDGMMPLYQALVAAAKSEFTCSSIVAEALLTDPTLVAAITPRETQVLTGLDQGLSHQQVARRLGVQESTVRSHLKSVREKYMTLGRNVTNTLSLIREADEEGWLDHKA
ncbi:response regulator transcription factor [Humibacillus sp. DSM 29435]|uniref:LuxR C-terminal-related transcriptional regulator n=1 Tax=Humibacillus sp. DSM 29435 TaxID=1869167 RepID=UPI001585DBB6|nr:response regulator transcription factor [Humibacillus sp. DSM 29435]